MASSYLNKAGLQYFYSLINQKMDERLPFFAKTTAEWNADRTIVSQANVLYIYTDYKTITKDGQTYNIPNAKFGDGNAYLIDLPFVAMDDEAIYNHISNTSIHVSQQDRSNWDEKVRCYLDPENNVNLVFTTD